MNKRSVGNKAELKALRFLESKGFTFIEKNFYSKGGEIDLILKDGDFVVFVEVKSLKRDQERDIFSTLSRKKKLRILTTINKWLFINNKQEQLWRFDFIGIVEQERDSLIHHFEFVSLQ